VDTPDSLLTWSSVSGKFVECKWLDSAGVLQITATEGGYGIDTIWVFVADTEYTIGSAIIVIVNPVEGLGDDIVDVPRSFALNQNYPNPFNPVTVIPYDLPEASLVDIRIYDIRGREIVTLVHGEQAARHYRINWNGRDKHENPVASGVYLYRMTAISARRQFTSTRKLVIMQ